MKDLLFRRYADPLKLLSTYTLKELGAFLVSLFGEQNEQELWEFYLHKVDSEISFKEFKKENTKSKLKALTKEEEEQQIEWSSKFVKQI